MRLGIPKEPAGETRVGIVPSSLKKLAKAGFEVIVERGAGIASSYLDHEYESAGAKFGSCLLYTSPSPRDRTRSRMPSSA